MLKQKKSRGKRSIEDRISRIQKNRTRRDELKEAFTEYEDDLLELDKELREIESHLYGEDD